MEEQQASTSRLLEGFQYERLLNEDARTRTAAILGRYVDAPPDERAVILVEKTHFSPSFYRALGATVSSQHDTARAPLSAIRSLGSNDVYNWMLGWMSSSPASAAGVKRSAEGEEKAADVDGDADAHVKLTLIRPASEAHIKKYSEQQKVMITETPEVYEQVVRPWIESQPVGRIQWVYNILDKKKEADTILYEDADAKNGFIVVPDLKWDQKTLTSLYLIAIVHDRSLRSLRSLTKAHVPLLRAIQQAARKVAGEKYGLPTADKGKLRCFFHYQPTYYHLHVHIVSSDYQSPPGAIVGQAHLLDDVIDLLEMGVDFTKRTLTYSLGEQTELYTVLCERLKL
ncbi:scavenger mRNA decapping enzyme [Acaromyces ingoldii]|uniref:m7GpppX diphosphatase n=1 Tax=Acaromyces ingoldii TaxID=215250 RepID=A0A316YUC9_9BASI|nr:scavenger mRNA decapping enzyme [Acaromyces ingoldii]PWN93180.1 scavenger mRNA decapping enzyme [Acaromyces ingoldii]